MQTDPSPVPRLQRVVAASLAFREFRARWRAGKSESLAAWLAQHADLGDALDEVVVSPAPEPDDDAAGDDGDWLSHPATGAADVPRELGGFVLLEEIDAGAHGSVWRARGPRHDGDVALKILHPHALRDGDLRERFRREARVASRLTHDNLCRVVAFDVESAPPWLAMAFVPGQTLDRLLAARRVPVDLAEMRRCVELVAKLAAGLQAAHAHDLVHRDVKPRNVIVRPDGEPVLVDFGLVREASSAGQLTVTGDHMGTLAYMAPEQVEGRHVDLRADVWALGVILFEALTGRTPFQGPTHERMAVAITRDPLPRLRHLEPKVPAALAVVVETALRKPLAQRYGTAAHLAEDLGRWLRGERVLARRPSRMRSAVDWCRANPLPAVLLWALLAALLGMTWLAAREADARTREASARQEERAAKERESQARAAAEAGEAARTFEAAQLQASYGRWPEAEQLYERARQLGHDEVAVDLGLIEIFDATFQADRSLALLDALDARADLGQHRAMVTLLRHDFSRQMIGGSGPPQWRKSREQVLAVVDSRDLLPAWREYARALVAMSVTEARGHLARALEVDPRHRPANEMWGPVVLLLDGPAAALEAARQFGVRYPQDPAPVFLEAMALSMLGRRDEAAARMDAANLPPAARTQIDVVAGVRQGVQDAWTLLLDRMIEMQVQVQPVVGSPPLDLSDAMQRALTDAVAPPLRHARDRDARGTSGADAQVLFRFPFSVMAGAVGLFVRLAPVIVTGQIDLDALARSWSQLPMSTLLGLRGALRLRDLDFVGAQADLAEAAAHDDLAGLGHHFAMLRVMAAVGHHVANTDAALVAQTRAAIGSAVEAALASPASLTRHELGYLARATAASGQPWRARELAARLVANEPDEPQAAAAAIGALACARLFARARQDLHDAEQRWPGDAALLRAAREIEKFERMPVPLRSKK